jgi:hypothetical protein
LCLQVPPWAELSHMLGGILHICKVLPAHPFLSWKCDLQCQTFSLDESRKPKFSSLTELLEAWCFKGVEEFIFLFFCFWFVLSFCRLLWSDLGELVLVMEHDPRWSMDIFYELCESRLYEWIGAELLGEWRDKEKRNIYDVGWSEGDRAFGDRMKLSF